MSVWLVLAGRYGGREALAFEKGLAVIVWGGLPNVSALASREDPAELCRKTYPGEKPMTFSVWVGQIWAFRECIQVGYLVVLPLKSHSAIAIGKVTGPYHYHPDLPEDARHTRSVEWTRKDLPRTIFDQDILYSFGVLMTVCQIQRNQ